MTVQLTLGSYRLFDKQFEPNVLKNQLHGFAKEKKKEEEAHL